MILQDLEAAEARSALEDVVTSVLARTSPRTDAVAHAEAAADGRQDAALWSRLSQEVGVVGLSVPEQCGGSGASFAETAVVFEQCGRWLTAVPLLGSWLASEAIVRSGHIDAAKLWVSGLAEGSTTGAVSLPSTLPLAKRVGEQWLLTGDLDLVVDGVTADVLIVPASTPSSTALALVPLDGVTRSQQETLDLTRQLARVRLEATPGIILSIGTEAVGLVEVLRDLAAVALACEQLGVAEQALADAVSYAGEREQFGRLIGSFQAVKHLLADMATAADLARSLLEHAVWAATEAPDRLREAAAMAFLQTSRAACFVSEENIQVHGGIGFSWEHTAHLYFRKARSNAALLGDRSFFSDRLLVELGVLESRA